MVTSTLGRESVAVAPQAKGERRENERNNVAGTARREVAGACPRVAQTMYGSKKW